MSSPNFRAVRLLISTVFLLLASLPALADSQVRIVRLSYIEVAFKSTAALVNSRRPW